jgi:hypothetical protein
MALSPAQPACSLLRGQRGHRQSGTPRAPRRRAARSHSPLLSGAAQRDRRIEHPGACALSRRVVKPESSHLQESAKGTEVSPCSLPPGESTRGGPIAHPEPVQAPPSGATREWHRGVGREKQLRLHLGLPGLHAPYPGIDAPTIRFADTLRALQMPIDKGMGGQRARLAARW